MPEMNVEKLDELLRRRASREARYRAEAEAFEKAIKTLYARLEALGEKHKRGLVWLDGEIEGLAVLLRNETGIRHWKLPYGDVGFRKSTKWTYPEDDAALVAWFERPENAATVPPGIDVVAVKKSVPKGALKEYVKATGILPDGVDTTETEGVTIKCDAAFIPAGVGDDDDVAEPQEATA